MSVDWGSWGSVCAILGIDFLVRKQLDVDFGDIRWMAASDCGFNRSMQHLISNDREEDVENEAATKDLLH